MEIINVLHRKFKTVIKIRTGLEKRLEDLIESFNKEIENVKRKKKNQIEIKTQ